MKKSILHCSLDVDDKAFHFFGFSNQTGEVYEFKCFPSVTSLIRKFEKLQLEKVDIKICYEASYLGYSLYRELTKKGYFVEIVAPSLIPERSSKKIKTDKLDAQKLAKILCQ